MTSDNTNTRIGARLRQRRIILGLSQTEVGNQLGVTFQQLQKYEKGQNRISAASLFEFCRVNKMDIRSFYDEVVEIPSHPEDLDERHDNLQLKKYGDSSLLSLFKHYGEITDPKLRSLIMELVVKLSATPKKDA